MAERKFQKKQRNSVKRVRKPVMLITAEGKNKTEQLYFSSFQSQHGKYSVKFIKTGNETDPEGMFKALDAYWKRNDLSEKYGDKAYIVLDLDCYEKKAKLIEELERKSKNIRKTQEHIQTLQSGSATRATRIWERPSSCR